MNFLSSKGWSSKGDRIWSETQGPFLNGLDFFLFDFSEEFPEETYVCVGYNQQGNNIWLVREKNSWVLYLDKSAKRNTRVQLVKIPERTEKTLSFVEKAQGKYGKKYDYSEVVFAGLTKKVRIICSFHGPFLISPRLHLLQRACSECEIFAKMEQRREDFVQRATKKHKGKYTYEKVKPLAAGDKAEITCPEHGSFFQNIHSHLAGRGCKSCPKKLFRVVDLKTFIQRSNETHNNKFDYSESIYVNKDTLLKIICPIHGPFLQTPTVHRQSGCPDCWKDRKGDAKRKPFDVFVKEARAIFGTQYDYSKTNYVSAHIKVVIICPKHGEFEQSPNNHIRGCGCRKCGRRGQFTTRDYIELARELRGDKYDYSKVDYQNSQDQIIIICPDHGEFRQIPTNHLQGADCLKCSNIYRRTTEDFIKEVAKIHNGKYGYLKTEFTTVDSSIIITCPNHGNFEQKARDHLRGAGCQKCSKKYRRSNEEFIKESNHIHNNFYDYSKTCFSVISEKVIIICPFHGDFEQLAVNHLSGHGCIDCAGIRKKDTLTFINEASKIHDGLYEYPLVDYQNCKTKVIITCAIHGPFQQRPTEHLKGSGCPTCKNSQGELAVRMILKEQKVEYEAQKKFDECRNILPLPFDFFIPSLNLLIEYDGEQHYKPIKHFGGEKRLKETQYRDSIKTKFAEENGYRLLRIRYDEDIREKLLPHLVNS